ncbi:MAG: hypothetical protein R2822_23805 [Spirosomataceae bacterium]
MTSTSNLMLIDMIGCGQGHYSRWLWGTSPTAQVKIPPVMQREKMLVTPQVQVLPTTRPLSQKIPVLFFFTGVHGDYHKPSDDTELINFEGGSQNTKCYI